MECVYGRLALKLEFIDDKSVFNKRRLTAIIPLLIAFSTFAQDQWRNVYRESAWKERDSWQRPDDLIGLLKIGKGSHVADVGCHEGYMTVKLAAIAGETGKVYAVDVDQPKLSLLQDHLEKRAIGNVNIIKGDYDDPKLPTDKLDAVIILDTYHEMDDHDKILQKIKIALKKGGRLLLCEPIAEDRRKLSRSEQEQKHELGMNFALEDLTKAGYVILYQKDPYIDRTKIKGDKMWVLVAINK